MASLTVWDTHVFSKDFQFCQLWLYCRILLFLVITIFFGSLVCFYLLDCFLHHLMWKGSRMVLLVPSTSSHHEDSKVDPKVCRICFNLCILYQDLGLQSCSDALLSIVHTCRPMVVIYKLTLSMRSRRCQGKPEGNLTICQWRIQMRVRIEIKEATCSFLLITLKIVSYYSKCSEDFKEISQC